MTEELENVGARFRYAFEGPNAQRTMAATDFANILAVASDLPNPSQSSSSALKQASGG